jgi:preprotein translocase subunit SecD
MVETEVRASMMHFTRWKMIAIALACLAGLLGTLPNFFSAEQIARWPRFLPHKQINYGLDLRGGAHFLLGMNMDELRRDWLANLSQEARKLLVDAKLPRLGLGVSGGRVQATFAKPEDADAALKELRKMIQPLGGSVFGGTGATNVDVQKGEGNIITIAPTDQGLRERETQAIGAAIETIRRRVDPDGTKEISIVRQGRERILLQAPGIDNPADIQKLKDLLKETAKLAFHDVVWVGSAEEARNQRIQSGQRLVESAERSEVYILREPAVVSGEDLADAQPSFDQRTTEPIISFRFNQSGARRFGKYTSDNVGRPFAIVLDNKVISAPVIREPILGGSGQISGSFTTESSNKLAIQLRSGALPASITIIEERTVGPSLGADSIKAGKIAALVGTLLVCAFMVFAYGQFGVFALLAVAINIAMILALMSLLGSTLTLPGIAGLVLTIGMAVDANVLIYERIREELRNGKTPLSAIDAGFDRALGTIIDSNLTTLIAGIVMFWLGSGPIRGFAVTLSLGIITTVFTAFTVTRLLIKLWVDAQKSRKIPAPL